MTTLTIGIIGGTGAMGRRFESYFTQAGHRVLIAGRHTPLTFNDLAVQSHIVIISVPIDAAERIAEEIGPLLNADQLLTDFCSLKEDIVNAMLRFTPAEVVGMHPLFGPFHDSIQGLNMVLCPGRGSRWLNWLEHELTGYGANVRRMTAETHDRYMAVFQGLTHIISISLGRTLQKLGISPNDTKDCSTPVFRISMDLVGRLFAQDLSLYEKLIGNNRHVPDVLNHFLSSIQEAQTHLFNPYPSLFLNDIRDFLGEFCQEALTESNEFLDVVYSKKMNAANDP